MYACFFPPDRKIKKEKLASACFSSIAGIRNQDSSLSAMPGGRRLFKLTNHNRHPLQGIEIIIV